MFNFLESYNGLRKLVILCINSSLDRFSINYKILISAFLLSMFYYVQKRMKPYKSDHNNKIDLLSMTTATVTIYSGVIFSLESDAYKGFKTFTWILVASFNGYFILNWTYLLMLSVGRKNTKLIFLTKILGYTLFCRNANFEASKKSLKAEILSAELDERAATPKKRVFKQKFSRRKTGRKGKRSFRLKGKKTVALQRKSRRKNRSKREKKDQNPSLMKILQNTIKNTDSEGPSCISRSNLLRNTPILPSMTPSHPQIPLKSSFRRL